MPDRPGVNWEANIYVRIHHIPRHGVTFRRNPLRRLASALREAADFVAGAFVPVREAMG
jgi:hypothetical protein